MTDNITPADAKAKLITLVEKIQKTHREYTADATLPNIPDNIMKLLFVEVLDVVRPFWSPPSTKEEMRDIKPALEQGKVVRCGPFTIIPTQD